MTEVAMSICAAVTSPDLAAATDKGRIWLPSCDRGAEIKWFRALPVSIGADRNCRLT
jgi:hypothetical protein